MFETTIRVLGGLLSGHMLLADDPGLAPGYDGLLLRLAGDLGDRLLAAFDTPSGLPGGHVHLQKVRACTGMLSVAVHAGQQLCACCICAATVAVYATDFDTPSGLLIGARVPAEGVALVYDSNSLINVSSTCGAGCCCGSECKLWLLQAGSAALVAWGVGSVHAHTFKSRCFGHPRYVGRFCVLTPHDAAVLHPLAPTPPPPPPGPAAG